MTISVKKGWEYESRIVLYGMPASQAQPVCEEMARELRSTLKARTECVQGTEG